MSSGTVHKILAGVDDTPDAQLAFEHAIRLAVENNAELVIATVMENKDINVYQSMDSEFLRRQHEILTKNLERYRRRSENAGVSRVTTLIATGDQAGETIVKKIIPQEKPDLLVIGSLDKRGITRGFGSQAAYMAKNAPVSVLVVR
ncbi:universal stress protein [Bifidobacterium sp.]|jgi:nucleotide-binding universal stress UspA family protein|uniref:universal stress protein n=1 Tax=Bifidobacterium sp. TaxID=41200 RepID=UPI0025C109A7|nr:universal stress protein [Bifidobacterium sp.]MCH4209980.1 universal stress protein [Bifidobacterium sp.]